MTDVPSPIRTVLEALRFTDPRPEALASIPLSQWPQVLSFLDRTQLTLVLLLRCREHLPPQILKRLEENQAANRARHERLTAAYAEIAAALEHSQVPFMVLKGFTQSPWFADSACDRVQYDLDFFSPPEHVNQARDSLLQLGYESLTGYERLPLDHLPALVRKTGWEWHGDYFDPGLPISVDLHFRFWNKSAERFEPTGIEEFWRRRQLDRGGGLVCPAMHPADRLGYTCLHLLRHILHGNLRPYHVYELAWFLHRHADDREFWASWSLLHDDSLRRLEAICFALSERWFHCGHPAESQEAIASLSEGIRAWIDIYALAPLNGLFVPNKHELWLHLNLVESKRDGAAVAIRRLFPTTLPGEVEAVLLPLESLTPWIRVRRRWKYLMHLASRAQYHARAILPSIAHGSAWWSRSRGIDPGFWRFLSAAWLFDLGMFVFLLLYNLHLIELGHKEDFLGLVTSAQTAGSFVAALPMGALVQRWGPGRLLRIAFVALAVTFAVRSLVSGTIALLVSAFCGGALLSAFAVAFAPAIARLTTEHSRPLGYGIFFSSGVAMGVLGGFLGGRLPGWLGAAGIPGKQGALLAACALVALAAWPASRLRLAHSGPVHTRVYPSNPVLWRFLAAIVVWNLATGAFNPFFNAYFTSHLHANVGRLGSIFAVSQIAQAAAMLSAPLVLRRFGLIRGIVGMQLAAALALVSLASASSAATGAAIYVAFMAAQWMSEPGMYSVLMNPLKPEELGGAAALNMMAILLAQLIAASAAGAAISRFGYPVTLGAAGLLAAVAGLMFWFLLRGTVSSMKAVT